MRSRSTVSYLTRTSLSPMLLRTSSLLPKLPAQKDKDMLKKKNYGKVPKYVTKIKTEIEDEYNLVREKQIERDKQKMLMPEDERLELIAALKKKWEVLHKDFQKEAHHGKLDTLGKKNRK